MNDLIFEKEKISTEDLVSAAKEIFSSQEEDFQKLKNSKWYHIFLRAFTLRGYERYIINDIKSLSKLQQLFIKIYVDDIKDEYARIDEIVGVVLEQNKAIANLYKTCILKIEEQKEPAKLAPQDMKILTMFLGEYGNSDGNMPEEVKEYNRNVFKSLPIQMAYGNFDGTQLSKVSEPEIFYRCFVEQCMVAGTLESQDWSDNVHNSLRYIKLSEDDKERIESAVKKEVHVAGKDYLYEKYIGKMFQFSDADFELLENSSGLSDSDGNDQDQGKTEDFEASDVDNAKYETTEPCSKEDYSDIREMISGIVGGMMKRNNKNEKIVSFIQKYNSHIAFDAAIEYVKLSNAEILFTTCGMNVALKGQKGLTNIKYADIDSKWVLSIDKENAKSECTKLIIDDGKGHRLELEDKSEYVEGIEKILSDSKKCIYAVTDIIIDEKEWPMQAKCLMGEILVDVYKLYYKKSTIESFRLFNGLSVSVEKILELFAYYGNSEPNEESVTDKIEAFEKYIPYPSKKSAGFTLGCKIVEMVQFSSGKPDERPTNIRKVIKSICDICNIYDYRGPGLDRRTNEKQSKDKKEIEDKLWDIGALPYRILKKKATKKEINEVGLELAGVAVGVGVPVVFSVIDSILFWASLGIAFVPGVDLIFWPALGAIFAGGAVGGGVVGVAKGIVNKVKQADMDAASEKELWKVERSYLNLYNNIQNMEDDKIRKIITDEIIKASGNADFGIKDCIRAYSTGKHSKDEFYIQAIKEKLSAKGAENKSGFILKTLLDMEEDKSAETLSKMLKRTYDVPVNSRKYNLKHHQILAVYESKKSKDLALVFTYEGLAITKKMIGDGDCTDKFVFYKEITKFRTDSKRLLLYLTIGHTNKKEDEVAISFFNPGILTELLVRLRQIEVTVFS